MVVLAQYHLYMYVCTIKESRIILQIPRTKLKTHKLCLHFHNNRCSPSIHPAIHSIFIRSAIHPSIYPTITTTTIPQTPLVFMYSGLVFRDLDRKDRMLQRVALDVSLQFASLGHMCVRMCVCLCHYFT